MKKRLIWSILTFIYIILIFIEISYFKNPFPFALSETLQNMIFSLISFYIIIFSIVGSFYFFFTLANKFSNFLFKVHKLSKVDILKSRDYYRDILKKYSVTELSYIDNYELNIPKDVVAILLQLQNLGKIILDEDKNRIIIGDKKVSLKKEEQYVLNCIYEGKIDAIDIGALTIESQKSALEDKLLIKVNSPKKKKSKVGKVILSFLIMIIVLLISIHLFNTPDDFYIIFMIIILFFAILISVLLFWGVSYFLYDTKKINNPYKRSNLGEEINQKLEGLKLFFQDFSLLDEKEAKELILWKDYLIYSVMFNQNKKIIEEYYNKYFEKDFN